MWAATAAGLGEEEDEHGAEHHPEDEGPEGRNAATVPGSCHARTLGPGPLRTSVRGAMVAGMSTPHQLWQGRVLTHVGRLATGHGNTPGLARPRHRRPGALRRNRAPAQ